MFPLNEVLLLDILRLVSAFYSPVSWFSVLLFYSHHLYFSIETAVLGRPFGVRLLCLFVLLQLKRYEMSCQRVPEMKIGTAVPEHRIRTRSGDVARERVQRHLFHCL